jgi:hypothetical protein
MDRLVGDLARDVPERDVDARQRVDHRPVPPDPVQEALHLVVDRGDLARVAADAHRPEQRVDGRARRRENAVAERLAPAGHSAVGVDAHEQHVDAGPGPAAEHRRGPVDHHRQREDDRLDSRDLHAR